MTKKIGTSSSYGNGIVSNNFGSFACENTTTGTLAGSILCFDVTNSNYDDAYFFKMSGDRGTGVGTWSAASYYHAVEVIRTATKAGVLTGINNATLSSVSIAAAPLPSVARKMPVEAFPVMTLEYARSLGENQPSAEEKRLINSWANEVRAILNN